MKLWNTALWYNGKKVFTLCLPSFPTNRWILAGDVPDSDALILECDYGYRYKRNVSGNRVGAFGKIEWLFEQI